MIKMRQVNRIFLNKKTGEILEVPVWDKNRIHEIELSGMYKELLRL